MKPVIYAILRVLQGNIQLPDGTDVRLIQSPPVTDHTPCITIDDSSNTRNLGKYFTNKDLPLPETHPQYDETEPEKVWSQQVIQEKRGIDLDLNIWCNTEDEREELYLYRLSGGLFHQREGRKRGTDHFRQQLSAG